MEMITKKKYKVGKAYKKTKYTTRTGHKAAVRGTPPVGIKKKQKN